MTAGGRGGGAGAPFLKALGGGVAGAIVGAGVYYAVRALTGYEIGIIAIAFGWLVGKGVSRGSGGRGGPRYQALAIVLTYLGTASTHVPAVLEELRKAPDASEPVRQGFAGAIGFAGLVLARPVLAGAENVIGLIILAIGLYEAWKINKTRTPVTTL